MGERREELEAYKHSIQYGILKKLLKQHPPKNRSREEHIKKGAITALDRE